MLEALGCAFECLEKEVAQGTVRSYGVSSDAFALDPSDPLFLDWRQVESTAAHAFASAATATSQRQQRGQQQQQQQQHNFRVLQLPINVLEPKGAEVARDVASFNAINLSQQQQQGQGQLRVMATRPLTAIVPLQLTGPTQTGVKVSAPRLLLLLLVDLTTATHEHNLFTAEHRSSRWRW